MFFFCFWGLFFDNLRFFPLNLPSMFYWNIFFFVRVTIYVCSKNSLKVVARSTCEKKKKLDVFKFYLNVRFWAWKKTPTNCSIYIHVYLFLLISWNVMINGICYLCVGLFYIFVRFKNFNIYNVYQKLVYNFVWVFFNPVSSTYLQY